jgi:hypothetical protein
MGVDDRLGDGQSEPGAAGAAGAGCVAAIEAIEHAGRVVGRHPRSVVGDDDLATITGGARTEVEPGVAVGVGEGIGDEGADDLLEPVGVTAGFDRRWRGDVDGDGAVGL